MLYKLIYFEHFRTSPSHFLDLLAFALHACYSLYTADKLLILSLCFKDKVNHYTELFKQVISHRALSLIRYTKVFWLENCVIATCGQRKGSATAGKKSSLDSFLIYVVAR